MHLFSPYIQVMNNYSDKLSDPIFHFVGSVADGMNLECYVIGGWVRDMFLHRHSKDIDIVVVGSGVAFAESIAERLGKRAHISVFRNFGTAQIAIQPSRNSNDILHNTELLEIEIVGARRESYNRNSRKPIVEDGTLQDDQNRRDFTINALALCLNKGRYGELLDPFEGLRDMEECLIRTPLDPDITFSDDPLRMMRGIRFSSQLGFYLTTETFDAISRNAERINIISRERVADELNKIMMSRKPSKGLILLEKTGLLKIIFPELDALKGVDSIDGRGHKDNFSHTMQVVDTVAEHSDKLWLRYAALLHDIGKPRTKQYVQGQGWTFHQHDFIGQKMIPNIFRRMKLPQNESMKYVQKLVGLHMRPISLIEDTVTDSAVRRLLFDAGDDIDDLMILCDADITSKNPEKVRRFHRNYEVLRQKMKDIEEKDRIRNFQPPIDGNQIMDIFNLPPCNEVGELKMAIKDAILDGIIPNEHDAAYQFMLKKAAKKGLYPKQNKD